MPSTVPVEQAEVVGTRTTPRDLQRIALHPGACLKRLVVGQLVPRVDHLARLLLHQLELRALVSGRVPRQHHPPDPLVVLAIADDRQPAAAGIAQLSKEVDLLDALAELLLVRRDALQQLGVRDHDQPPPLGRDPDRVDVPEPAEVPELGVVVVQDVEVREPLSVRHQPAHGVRDVQRRVVTAQQPRFDTFRRLFRLVDHPLEPARDQPQDRPGCGVAQLHRALRGDLHPPDPPLADVDAVGAAVVDDRPTAVLDNDDGVPAGHPDVRHDDGTPGVATDQVSGARLQAQARPRHLHHQRWDGAYHGTPARRVCRQAAHGRHPNPVGQQDDRAGLHRCETRRAPVPTRASARPPPMAMTGAARLPSHLGKDPLAGW